MLTRSAQHAIRAMCWLADTPPGRLSPLREISAGADVPLPFLSKLLTLLTRHDLVRTRRGPNGGAMLGREATRVTIGEIVAAVDGASGRTRCYLGLPECRDEAPCPLHHAWTRVRAELDRTLHGRTLAELTRSLENRNEPAAQR